MPAHRSCSLPARGTHGRDVAAACTKSPPGRSLGCQRAPSSVGRASAVPVRSSCQPHVEMAGRRVESCSSHAAIAGRADLVLARCCCLCEHLLPVSCSRWPQLGAWKKPLPANHSIGRTREAKGVRARSRWPHAMPLARTIVAGRTTDAAHLHAWPPEGWPSSL
ncbi:hypothetical protein Dimus_033801 [Dionaea muscipula]